MEKSNFKYHIRLMMKEEWSKHDIKGVITVLKKAIAKFSPKEHCIMAVIYWTSRKGNESKKVIAMPYINRKQRKGRL